MFHRRPALSLVALAVAASAVRAEAGDPKEHQACADAYDTSQELRDAGKLRLARAQLVVCQTACPPVLAAECQQWRRDVEDRLSSVVLTARDRSGKPLHDVAVRIDGSTQAQPVGSAAVELDPGAHTFVFLRDDGSKVEVPVTLTEREKGRVVAAVFAGGSTGPAAPPQRSAQPSPVAQPGVAEAPPVGAYVFGVVGLAALTAAGVLTIKGHVDRNALNACKERGCAPEEVDAVRATWWVAAGVAGAGGVSLAVATVLWVSGSSGSAKRTGSGRAATVELAPWGARAAISF